MIVFALLVWKYLINNHKSASFSNEVMQIFLLSVRIVAEKI